VFRHSPPITTLVAAAATVPQTTPRRTSGPGRMSIQFFDHQTLILSHTSFPRSHRDMSHPPSITTTLGVLRFRNGRKILATTRGESARCIDDTNAQESGTCPRTL